LSLIHREKSVDASARVQGEDAIGQAHERMDDKEIEGVMKEIITKNAEPSTDYSFDSSACTEARTSILTVLS
jgi:hypothetical protein